MRGVSTGDTFGSIREGNEEAGSAFIAVSSTGTFFAIAHVARARSANTLVKETGNRARGHTGRIFLKHEEVFFAFGTCQSS